MTVATLSMLMCSDAMQMGYKYTMICVAASQLATFMNNWYVHLYLKKGEKKGENDGVTGSRGRYWSVGAIGSRRSLSARLYCARCGSAAGGVSVCRSGFLTSRATYHSLLEHNAHRPC